MISLFKWGIACPSLPLRWSRCFATFAEKGDEGWQTVIGLEIHAQIKTGKKLFSKASTSYGHVSNTNVDVHDAAFPGTLPVLDINAIRLSIMTALALNCQINPRSTFDRKHYFYHDIPASYQITQHYNPLAWNGHLEIQEGDNGSKRTFSIGIKQLQVEQDTAKSQTVGDGVLVDLNRAGTGLMEIVTDPDMRSPEEAGAFVKKLQGLLRRVRSADGDMEKGNLRVDVNVSVHRAGMPFGTRCEIKNINSVRFLQAAIESERLRHIAHYCTSPLEPLAQETRGFNELTLQTYSLRSKEEATDYRYMPDHNLPAIIIDDGYLDTLRKNLPEMPWQIVERLVKAYGVTKRDAETLLGLDEYGAQGIAYFEEVVKQDKKIAKKATNWIAHELLGQLGKANRPWTTTIVPAPLMHKLVIAVESRQITGTIGKAIVKHLVSLPESAPLPSSFADLLAELGFTTSAASVEDLTETCRKAINNQPKAVADFKKGNEKVVMRLVGEVMKLSAGKADAMKAKNILLDLLKE
ncbi:glutamyl-tRNA(Gln) amidotransferase subunit B, mitochondrial [Cryptococcus neoformans]|nr:aspartyl/glutamyl-tRNA(Asn/Gln) amidotransferase, B subunit [Cryptococcus neoformans var. grubii]OXC59817.1 aspartyl/glutamyl-tRNA(Asn/Gln) amidotransferase, B subunit [Cryptococcus neoformans var. grubii MW-RSA852]UOH83168.1 glutamyl-tRNA(Gln) amidotransferase subunit B, mitochondrial [Cryptococcus neoformans]